MSVGDDVGAVESVKPRTPLPDDPIAPADVPRIKLPAVVLRFPLAEPSLIRIAPAAARTKATSAPSEKVLVQLPKPSAPVPGMTTKPIEARLWNEIIGVVLVRFADKTRLGPDPPSFQ